MCVIHIKFIYLGHTTLPEVFIEEGNGLLDKPMINHINL